MNRWRHVCQLTLLRSGGIRHLYRTSQGGYRFETKVSMDPRHEAKLHEILRDVLRELPGDPSARRDRR